MKCTVLYLVTNYLPCPGVIYLVTDWGPLSRSTISSNGLPPLSRSNISSNRLPPLSTSTLYYGIFSNRLPPLSRSNIFSNRLPPLSRSNIFSNRLPPLSRSTQFTFSDWKEKAKLIHVLSYGLFVTAIFASKELDSFFLKVWWTLGLQRWEKKKKSWMVGLSMYRNVRGII
jgi:hypothetical protein